MVLPLKFCAALGLVACVLTASPALSAEAVTPNDTARFLAGLPPSAGSPLTALTQDPAWQQHAQLLNTAWAGLEQDQLSRVRSWSRANVTARRPVTYYFFSGPDFVYVDAFFPDSTTYILAGLEPIGPIPDVMALKSRSIGIDLEAMRTSMSTLLGRSYFITSYMGSDLRASQLRGTLPILYVFLARTGKTIHEVSFVAVGADGTLQPSTTTDGKDVTNGVKIVYSGSSGKRQEVYYFRTDLSNKGVRSSGFLEFCRKFGIGNVFIKAASYLLHTQAFSIARDFLLGMGATVVQDDTGVPLRYFDQQGWRVQPFGRYVGPIAVFRGNFQSKLKTMFDKGGAPPIDFGIGYRWRTNESHVLLATNPNPQSLPAPVVPAPATPPAKSAQEAPAAEKTPDKTAAAPPVPPPPARPDKTPEKTAAPPVAPAIAKTEKTAASRKAQPSPPSPPVAPPSEASRFMSWPSLLFGGLFSAAFVSVFGLEGLARTLGFLAQLAVLVVIAWVAIGYWRPRDAQPAMAERGSTFEHARGEDEPSYERTRRPTALAELTRELPSRLAQRLKRWSKSEPT